METQTEQVNGGQRSGVAAGRRKFVVPIGPQHPALKEPGHFAITVEGEVVTAASVRLGYVHRGIEKGVEQHNWAQSLYMLERICGICSHVHATAYAIGVEQLAGTPAPPRAQAIRVLVAELERVHSHLLWVGVAAHEGGFDTLFMYSWRDRETVMDLLEALTGNRVNYSANLIGGVKCDVNEKLADQIRRGVDFLEERTKHYLKVVTTDETMIARIRGVGKMTAEEAERLGAVGPTARGSGVRRDVRVDHPYAAYNDFPIEMVVEQAGDLEAKFVVRLKELLESYRVIREILEKLPPGEVSVKVKPRIPAGETVSRVEAPRGELFYFLKSAGGTNPDRV
ncbi:MAG: NADH dehydrogenase subunit, partial [Acidobacteria bacterium]